MPDPKRWYRIITLLPIFPSICRAALVNKTIDDSFGDSTIGLKPIYNPPFGRWSNLTCSDCAIQPLRSFTYDGTYTAATYSPGSKSISITLEFFGVSIWVFFILATESDPTIITNTTCNFTLDGSFVGTFVHQPDINAYGLEYNATVFSATSLRNIPHQLIISTNDVPYDVYVNFDYAIYTALRIDPPTIPLPGSTPSPPIDPPIGPGSTSSPSISISGSSSSSTSSASSTSTSAARASAHPPFPVSGSTSSSTTNAASNHQANQSSTSSLNIGTIVGPVLGGVAFIVIVLMFFLFRRRSKSREEQVPVAQPLSGSNDVFVTASLLPIRRDQPAQLVGNRKNQDEIRAMRQREIDQRLQSTQHQMENLTSRQSIPPLNNGGVRSAAEDQEMENMREQIRMLRGQIENLQMERQSDWAMGLSDEPPPSYVRGNYP